MRFTANQQLCIEFCEQRLSEPLHLVIEAGAGAGKTAVLAQRVLWTLCDAPANHRLAPHEITLATFTRAAERELRERVSLELADRMPGAAQSLHISTIDSLLMSLFDSLFAGFWFEAFGSEAVASPPSVSLVDEAEIQSEIERDIPQLLEQITTLENAPERAAIFDFILAGAFKGQSFSQEFRSSDPRQELSRFMLSEACLLLSSPKPEIIQESVHCGVGLVFDAFRDFAYRRYLGRLEKGRITHTDRLVFLHNIYCAAHSFRAGTIFESFEPAPLLAFREIIVDEYQDTNPAQHDLLLTLAKRLGARMIVVGDPKQSLYGFRRAKVEVFRNLSESPDWRRIVLDDNFRSEARLLGELNALAQLALTYEDSGVPLDFWQSPHGQAARRSQVEAMDLKPGRKAEDHPHLAPVTIFTHSLDRERLTESMVGRLAELDVSYRDLSAERLVSALEHLLQAGILPSQCAVLCETNRDCDEVTQILRAAGLPIRRKASASRSPKRNHALRSCLVLLELVTGSGGHLRPETQTLGLFDLFTSPLFSLSTGAAVLIAKALCPKNGLNPLRPDETRVSRLTAALEQLGEDICPRMKLLIEEMFGKKGDISLLQTELAEIQCLGGNQPLGAWLSVAQRIAQASGYQFSRSPYEAWALAFSEQLETSGLWHHRPKLKIRRTSKESLERVTSLLPQSLLRSLDVNLENDNPLNEAIECMTVHGAKGLQWDAVIFFPQSRTNSTKKSFRCLQLGDRNVIQWFDTQGHLEIFSRVSPRIIEDKQNLTNYLRDYSLRTPQNDSDYNAFLELKYQEEAEQLFERARIFYTAITRAKKHLVLLSGFGTSNQRKSIRDLLAKLKPDSKPSTLQNELSDLPKYCIGRYLDLRFKLRSYYPEGKKRGALPLEPWLETEELCLWDETTNDQTTTSPRVRFIDSAGPTFETRALRAKELKAKIKQGRVRNSPQASFLAQAGLATERTGDITALPWRATWRWSEFNPSSPTREAQDNGQQEELSLGRFEKAHEGILVHAEEELNALSYLQDPISDLRRISDYSHTEWEVWTPVDFIPEQKLSLPSSSRNIVDLICVCKKGLIPHAFRGAPLLRLKVDPIDQTFEESDKPSLFSQSTWQSLGEESLIWVIVDYKTGKPSPDHQRQMERYLKAVAPLSSGYETGAIHLIGCLAYLDRMASTTAKWKFQFYQMEEMPAGDH